MEIKPYELYTNSFSIPQDIYWVIAGIYYGYPTCCINWFINHSGEHNDIQATVNNSLGFMPCPTCAEQVYYGRLKITDLITNRICKSEFPKGGTQKSRENYVNTQKKFINTLFSIYKP